MITKLIFARSTDVPTGRHETEIHGIVVKESTMYILDLQLQLTPALTDFKGLTIFIRYRRISTIAITLIKEKLF